MVPFYPGKEGTMRMPAGLHVKISAGDQLLGPRASLSIDHGEHIVVFVGMDKHHPALIRRHGRSCGIAKTRRNRCGRANRQRLTVQAAASFHKIDLSTGHTKVPATVSHPRPYGESWCQVARRLASWWQAHQHAAV